MAKVTGIMRNNFKPRGTDTEITGVNIYLGSPIDPTKGKGTATEKVYLSDRKIEENHLDLENLLGKNVRVLYNKFGKVETIEVIS